MHIWTRCPYFQEFLPQYRFFIFGQANDQNTSVISLKVIFLILKVPLHCYLPNRYPHPWKKTGIFHPGLPGEIPPHYLRLLFFPYIGGENFAYPLPSPLLIDLLNLKSTALARRPAPTFLTGIFLPPIYSMLLFEVKTAEIHLAVNNP
jgi:hypothetical protein